MRRIVVVSLALALVAMTEIHFAWADQATKVVTHAADPAAIAACTVAEQRMQVTVGDRTQHDLLSITFHFALYDKSQKELGGTEVAYAPSPALGGGQSAIYTVNVGDIALFAGTKDQIAYETCEIQSAIFSGNHIWAEGNTWAEQLVNALPPTAPAAPVAAAQENPSTTAEAPSAQTDSGSPPSHGPEMTVLSSWTTPGQDTLYLHVRVNLHPSGTVSTQGSDFRLLLKSKSGGSEAAYGLTSAAPTYLKVDRVSGILAALNRQATPPPVTSAAIAPFEDIGVQHQVQIFPGDPVTEVVTFAVRPDTNIDPKVIASTLQWIPSTNDDSASGTVVPTAPSASLPTQYAGTITDRLAGAGRFNLHFTLDNSGRVTGGNWSAAFGNGAMNNSGQIHVEAQTVPINQQGAKIVFDILSSRGGCPYRVQANFDGRGLSGRYQTGGGCSMVNGGTFSVSGTGQ